jgi:hypothetical protein
MSEAMAKATRRDLRRAMGPGAVSRVRGLEEEVKALRAQVVAGDYRTGKRIADVHRRVDGEAADRRDATAPLRRGLWGRLRWLVRGV